MITDLKDAPVFQDLALILSLWEMQHLKELDTIVLDSIYFYIFLIFKKEPNRIKLYQVFRVTILT